MDPLLITTTQGDFGFTWLFNLTDGQNAPVNITSASAITFECQLISDPTVKFSGAVTVVNGAGGECSYTVQATDFEVAGTYYAQIKVHFGPSETVTFPPAGITIQVDPNVPQ